MKTQEPYRRNRVAYDILWPVQWISVAILVLGTLSAHAKEVITGPGGNGNRLFAGGNGPAVSGLSPRVALGRTPAGGASENAGVLTLDRMVYCLGESWKLSIANAPANSAMGLMGVSNGAPWEWPGWGTTDNNGSFSASGTFADGSQGRHSLYVEIGGGKSNTVSFSVSDCKEEEGSTLIVPFTVSSTEENGSFFTYELTLTNRGAANLILDYRYKDASGNGSGLTSDSLPAGQQRVIPDAIAYLKSLGMLIPNSAVLGGTLSIQAHNLVSDFDFGATVRAITNGAGGIMSMGYPAIRPSDALYDPAYIFGLRQGGSERSSLALQNLGRSPQGDITLRLTLFSGDPPFQQAIPDITLSAGERREFPGILQSNGTSLGNGYVRIERVQGTAPYYASAIIDDGSNSTFIKPVLATELHSNWFLPEIAGTDSFSSELVLVNRLARPANMFFSYATSDGVFHNIPVGIPLGAGQQAIIPDLIQYLGIRKPFVWALWAANCMNVDTCYGEEPGIWLGARTHGIGARIHYSAFNNPVPYGAWSPSDAWLYDLKQDETDRSYLTLVNKGAGTDAFRIDVFDGSTGQMVNTVDGITLEPFQWKQIADVLVQPDHGTTQGYAHVTSTSGSSSFVTYAVIVDGHQPGAAETGTLISSSQSAYQPHLEIDPSPAPDGFCPQGVRWILQLTYAPPNSSVQLVGDAAGVPPGFKLPEGARTDYQGNFSASGPITLPAGKYNLSVEVGGLRSNTVLVEVFGDCE